VSIKYEINQWGKSKITPVVCIKETPKQVWIERTDYSGRKDVSRRSKENTFFDTWKEAHNFLVNQATKELQGARITLEHKEYVLTLLEAMTEPTAETQP
jgi:hypothetical protein